MLFRKRSDASSDVPPAAPPAIEREISLPPGSGRTVIGTHTRVKGTLKGEGSVVVRGTVEGEIAIGGGLTVAQSGRLEAEVAADSVDLSGQGKGSMRATSRVTLAPSAVFEGEMSTPVLEMHPGSVLHGRTRVAGVPTIGRGGLSH
jgi:cytoskeletal protein CcmA (bactofilin family)